MVVRSLVQHKNSARSPLESYDLCWRTGALQRLTSWLHLCVDGCLALLQPLSLFYDSHSEGHCVHKTTWPRKHWTPNNKGSPIREHSGPNILQALSWLALLTMFRNQVTGLNVWFHALHANGHEALTTEIAHSFGP